MRAKDIKADEYRELVEERIYKALDGRLPLDECARYAAIGGGKRLRAMAVYYGALAAGGNADVEDMSSVSLGVELIHNYSLVHDDLPAMDNGLIRRGKPSVQVQFGEANAILTGDLLLTIAFEELLSAPNLAAREIVYGAKRMVYGQYSDLYGDKDEKSYLDMYADKTCAMIVAPFRAGALLAGGSEELLSAVTEYAIKLGYAFQIADDLLDGDPSIVDVIGEDRARAMLNSYTDDCIAIAKRRFGSYADLLSDLAENLKRRKS